MKRLAPRHAPLLAGDVAVQMALVLDVFRTPYG